MRSKVSKSALAAFRRSLPQKATCSTDLGPCLGYRVPSTSLPYPTDPRRSPVACLPARATWIPFDSPDVYRSADPSLSHYRSGQPALFHTHQAQSLVCRPDRTLRDNCEHSLTASRSGLDSLQLDHSATTETLMSPVSTLVAQELAVASAAHADASALSTLASALLCPARTVS